MQRRIVIRDAWGAVMAHCTGPTASGACPRAQLGEIVPCAGHTIEPETTGRTVRYEVGVGEVSCPVTDALALAGSPDVARVA